MAIQLFNTLSRKKEDFEPIIDGKVSMYCCGPTVYNYAHIGNLRAFLFEDILRRVLEYNDFDVTHVTNVTDVGHLTDDGDEGEDKMEAGAKREGKTVWDIAKHYTDAFLTDLDKLNIKLPTKLPKATDHIDDMIAMIKILEEKGFTYILEGNVYFDTAKFPYYADLGKMNLEFLKETARVSEDEGQKKSKSDFVLWFTNSKFENHAMQWDSPWGKGYPGWHIECSAMSTKYLGTKMDIHCGGVDHIQVHHSNEIAQTECCYDNHNWVNFWMHSEFLVFNGGKMSKSDGTFVTLSTLEEKGYTPEEYRYYTLNTHYRQKLNFSYVAFDNVKSSFASLKKKVLQLKSDSSHDSRKSLPEISSSDDLLAFQEQFLAAINDDLNTPKALGILHDVFKSSLSSEEKLVLAYEFDEVFGLGMESWAANKTASLDTTSIQSLLDKRAAAREQKDWELADSIRDELKEKGFIVKDGPDGQIVEKA